MSVWVRLGISHTCDACGERHVEPEIKTSLWALREAFNYDARLRDSLGDAPEANQISAALAFPVGWQGKVSIGARTLDLCEACHRDLMDWPKETSRLVGSRRP